MVQVGNFTNVKIELDLFRHMVLNSIRSYNMKFGSKYGELVIACDDRKSWRRAFFPYYKANRRKDRSTSEVDWGEVFECLDTIKGELKEYFPYRVVQCEEAEADDIIGVLCNTYGNTSEKILIISGDKDFRQLHSFLNVEQYDPVRKKFVVENNPTRYLNEHIIRGDRSDGVPNFLSSDDTFVLNKTQKRIQTKKLETWVDQIPGVFCDENMLRGWKRNQQLVDLSFTPAYIKENIIKIYESEQGKNKSKLFTFFVEKRLRNLMECINEF